MTMGRSAFAALGWPAVLCASLALHGGVAFWLMRAEPAQAEGDLPQVLPMEVAFVAAPLPAAPSPEPVEETAEEDTPPPEFTPPALPEPLPAPVLDPVVPEPEPAPPETLAKAEPPKPQEKTKPVEQVPPKKKQVEKKPAKKPPVEKTPAKEKTADAKPSKKPAVDAGPAKQAKPAKAGNAAGNRKWASKIRTRIERKKKYPSAAKGATGSVTVSIRIAASGGLAGVAVAGSSGNAALDAAALKAVKSAAPFPPAPDGQSGAEFSLTMVFSRG